MKAIINVQPIVFTKKFYLCQYHLKSSDFFAINFYRYFYDNFWFVFYILSWEGCGNIKKCATPYLAYEQTWVWNFAIGVWEVTIQKPIQKRLVNYHTVNSIFLTTSKIYVDYVCMYVSLHRHCMHFIFLTLNPRISLFQAESYSKKSQFSIVLF